MRFVSPQSGYLFMAVAAVAVFIYLSVRRRRRNMTQFVATEFHEDMAPSVQRRNMTWKNMLLVAAFVFAVLALMRPQWGFHWQEVKRQGLDIFVAVDVSRSMLTEDIRPNRLERSKLAVRDLVKKLRGDRIGLIAFAGKGFLVCPLTVDYKGFLLTLDDLSPEVIPKGGTNLADAIDKALRDYAEVPGQYKTLIMITDGENLQGNPLARAEAAAEAGVRIFCVGVGTRKGELIRVTGPDGSSSFLKDAEGQYVKSRLNEALLQKIALATGGMYVRASGAEFGLELIYDQRLAQLERREIEGKMKKIYHERYQIPLGLFLVCLLGEMLIPERKG